MRVETPLGPATIRLNREGAITEFHFREGPADDLEYVPELAGQLEDFFAGRRHRFDLPLEPRGTEFQKRVWAELVKIPFGCTISYGELARRIGNPAASRAVGRANATNPIALIVPCHRVVGGDGSLTGYGGGIELKARLLEWEAGAAG